MSSEWSGIDSEDFSSYDFIFIANINDIQHDTVNKLKHFVQQGGGLFFFAGEKVNSEVYNASLGELLPLTLKKTVTSDRSENGWTIAPVTGDNPVAKSAKKLNAELMDTARFVRVIDSEPKEGSTVVLSLNKNDMPLLAEKPMGAGKVFFFTSTADIKWTGFPLHPLYLMMVDQIVTNITSDPSSLQFSVGQPAFVRAHKLQAGTSLELENPTGVKSEVKVIAPDNKPAICTFNGEVPGIYNLADKDINIGSIAVNVDASESNVKSIDEKSLTTNLSKVSAEVISGSDNLSAIVKDSRMGVELTKILLYLGIFFFLLQSFLAMLFSKKSSKKEHDISGTLLKSNVAAARRS